VLQRAIDRTRYIHEWGRRRGARGAY